MTRARPPARPISTARLLVGILLHFCVPAYLLACLAAALMVAPPVTGWDKLPARMLWTAAWFVPALVTTVLLAVLVGKVVDRRRPAAPDPVTPAREQVAAARRALAPLADARLARALARIEGVGWDEADPRAQQVAADLEAAARTFAAAIGSADAAGRPAVLALATASVDRLADALDEIARERQRLDAGDAQTVARYIDARYR